ncbi:MAG: hypothetical protein Q7R35_06125 [Elusimicrobiota bacterium]|nr:hypothetical protein [Elusimicrobiota bacterium]
MPVDINDVLKQLEQLKVMTIGNSKSPHKYLFLLMLTRLYAANPKRENRFPISEELENSFRSICREIYPNTDFEKILIEFPYYSLKNDGIWELHFLKNKEDAFNTYEKEFNRRLTIKRLKETIEYGTLTEGWDQNLRNQSGRENIVKEIMNALSKIPGPTSRTPSLPRLNLDKIIKGPGNLFVGYLNSLSQINANNENALAEHQACNPLFAHIHVAHPLTEKILSELKKPQGRQVILTGHAGDGKSSIALEVYKRLMSIPSGQPLPKPLLEREVIPGTNITIVKDLSERKKSSDATLMKELLTGARRYLIVSNTGTLLDLFRLHAESSGMSQVTMESDVLNAIATESGESELSVNGIKFLVINLAMLDNLKLARTIFERMLDPERWASCAKLDCCSSCPICLNVNLISHHRETILNRIFLAYRRMYEYGTRLTIRQITEHLAYLITSGLEENDIANMRERQETPLKAEFMFFNRFFGDNGKEAHDAAYNMMAISKILKQGFGERPSPTWERKLWLTVRDKNFKLDVADCEEEFELLREYGSGVRKDMSQDLNMDQARDQVRRMLYFLYKFPKEEQAYLKSFLNSSTIIRWQEWQKSCLKLEMTEKSLLSQRIYHVLQENFSGVRLPEGTKSSDRLYITLNRGNSEIRQSAQVVLAQIDWSTEVDLQLIPQKNTLDETRIDLELRGLGRIAGAKLTLKLPFLDYVLMRHFGEAGEILQPAYIERLERFKAQLQEMASGKPSEVMLVRLKTDHTFRRQQYVIAAGKLEVNDAN